MNPFQAKRLDENSHAELQRKLARAEAELSIVQRELQIRIDYADEVRRQSYQLRQLEQKVTGLKAENRKLREKLKVAE